MHRGQPNRVKSEVLNVVQFGTDAIQVADPVSVRIAERIDKDLIRRAVFIISVHPRQVLVEIQHLDSRNSGLSARCLICIWIFAASCNTQHCAKDHAYCSL